MGRIEENRAALSGALQIQKEIDRLRDQLCDLQAGGVSTPFYGERVQSSSGGGSAGEMAAELLDEIARLEVERTREAIITERDIERLHLPEREEKLLLLRYVRCLPWKEVAVLMGYTRMHINRMERHILNFISVPMLHHVT